MRVKPYVASAVSHGPVVIVTITNMKPQVPKRNIYDTYLGTLDEVPVIRYLPKVLTLLHQGPSPTFLQLHIQLHPTKLSLKGRLNQVPPSLLALEQLPSHFICKQLFITAFHAPPSKLFISNHCV